MTDTVYAPAGVPIGIVIVVPSLFIDQPDTVEPLLFFTLIAQETVPVELVAPDDTDAYLISSVDDFNAAVFVQYNDALFIV